MTPFDPDGNPLRRGLRRTRRAPPCTLVIFGATGDLTRRKLLPALFALAAQDLLDDRTHIVGVSRRDWSDERFRSEMRAGVAEHAEDEFDAAVWGRLEPRLCFHQAAYTDAAAFEALASRVAAAEEGLGEKPVRVFYLATPPSVFAPVAENLGSAGLLAGADEGRARLVVEKPFGHDLETAQELNSALRAVAPESAIFRIDHYLGKETVQNLLVFRFANGMFEPLWNGRYVDHVQITVAESLGVGGRGGYYEQSGAVRDMVQNHLFHVLALTAMEPPVAFEAGAVRDEKVKALRALRPLDPAQVGELCVRGQYTRGAPHGTEIPGYREEEGVPIDSTVETYVALKVFIDNWRWAGVPFYLRSGKGLPHKASEVAIHFKEVPHRLFEGAGAGALENNVLAIRLQPDEGMSLRFLTKVPGPEMVALPVTMEFRYGTSFGDEPPDAYERLLLDALVGDGTLFTRDDEVEVAWRWISALRAAWPGSSIEQPAPYFAGTWGPDSADRFMARDGRRWRRP